MERLDFKKKGKKQKKEVKEDKDEAPCGDYLINFVKERDRFGVPVELNF